MLAAGWLAEVEKLVSWGYTRAYAAMHSLGYRELLAYVEGEMRWDDTVTAIKKATCHLAKRQLTWFRKMAHVRWFNLSSMDEQTAVAALMQHLRAELEGRGGRERSASNVDAGAAG
jgi:tRNA dimethylallyltransferase